MVCNQSGIPFLSYALDSCIYRFVMVNFALTPVAAPCSGELLQIKIQVLQQSPQILGVSLAVFY